MPRRLLTGRWPRALVANRVTESALTVGAFALLREFGLCAHIPVWAFAAVTAVSAALSRVSHSRLRAATSGWRLHLRIASSVAAITAVMYATGWGPMLALGYLFGVAENLQTSGSRAVRPCVLWGVAGIVAGQCAIAFGAAPSLTAAPQVHGLAVLAALGFAFTTVILGSTTSRAEGAEESLRHQMTWNESLLQNLSELGEGMVVVDDMGKIVYANAAYRRITGYSDEELRALGSVLEIMAPEARPPALERQRRRRRGQSIAAAEETTIVTKDGRRVDIESSVQTATFHGRTQIIALIRDITPRKRVEADLAARMGELALIAATDPLTGLANRRELERILAEPRVSGFAMLVIDVDHLKAINDTYGHEAGDAHIRIVAQALRMGVREGDRIARSGGDEFVVVMPDTSREEASAVAHRLCQIMHGVAVPHGQARISIGCAVGSADADGFAVWGAADAAMYRAKQRGRDRVEVSAESATVHATSMAHWEPILPSLILERRVVAVFQPIVSLDDGKIRGYEALARMADGPVETSVESLFSTAQRLGVHRDLDWVCRRAAVQDAQSLPPGATLFVNVGVSALLDPLHDVDQMCLLLRWAGRPTRHTVLEITEREAVRDLDRLRDVLHEYRRHGFRFALDDVGEGHSTFEVLAAATPEFIKISAKLTRWAHHRGPQAVIRSLVTFAEATSTRLIAEGIETLDDAERMRELGVTLGQGFAVGRPAVPEPWQEQRSRAVAGS